MEGNFALLEVVKALHVKFVELVFLKEKSLLLPKNKNKFSYSKFDKSES